MYPRPDFRRNLWLDLQGKWKFMFDDYEEPVEYGLNPDNYDLEINVPYPFQSKLSGIGDNCFHDVVWYLREFKIPSQYRSLKPILKFGAVDYEATVWLNGRKLGEHVGGYDSFSFDLTGLVSEDNVLVVRVVDRHGDQPRGKQDSRLYPRGVLYSRVTGIWQPVWIEFTGRGYVDHFTVNADIDGSITLKAFLDGLIDKLKLRVEVSRNGEVLASSEMVASKEMTVMLKVDGVEPWSPDNPVLYDLSLILVDEESGEEVDRIYSYVGFRRIEVSGNKILLNGKPVFLQFALDQGYYPDGIYVPSSVERFEEDLKALLDMGFNGVRAHQKPPDPRYLYFADKLGVLVWLEMADWGMSLKRENLEVFWSQWRNIILRDYNHPCIIAWVPFNERSEARSDPYAMFFISEIYWRTKRLDPTRPVVDTSGYAHVVTDILDIHDYSIAVDVSPEEFRKSWNEAYKTREFLIKYGRIFTSKIDYTSKPIVLSEFGGWGLKGQKPIIRRPVCYYGDGFDNVNDLLETYEKAVINIAKLKGIAGYCYTQLYDVEGELNGLLTYDRRNKVNRRRIREANVKAKEIYYALIGYS